MKNKNKKYIVKNILISFTFLLSFFIVKSYVFASDITQDNVVNLINQQRTEQGLSKLNVNSDLNNAARLKAKDMLNRNYFEHFAFGLTPWDFIIMSGYNYLYAGENLAMDFNTSENMTNAWMNSPSHRDNILNPDYADVGVGIVKGVYTENGITHQTTMVVNMFGRKKPKILQAYDYVAETIKNMF